MRVQWFSNWALRNPAFLESLLKGHMGGGERLSRLNCSLALLQPKQLCFLKLLLKLRFLVKFYFK